MHNKNSSDSSTQLSLELRKDMKKKKEKRKTSQERMNETNKSIEEFNCNLLLCKDNSVSRIELVELVHEALVQWPVKKTHKKNKTKTNKQTNKQRLSD